tara:strand:- start:368 stop:598 length:231 start_codon:yes stop_codon:yes gene_type:complete
MKEGIVSRMPWIAKLAADGNLKELTEEVGSEEVAQGFIDAHKEMRDNKDKAEYKELNKIHDKMGGMITSIGYRGED